MNVTKDVIIDLYPLYADQECSADTRALVEEYLRANPAHAEELRRVMGTQLPGTKLPGASLEETRALREARRRVRWRATVMGLAIFFSLCPFSVEHVDGKTHWLLIESPLSAAAYAAVGLVLWTIYFKMRKRSNSL